MASSGQILSILDKLTEGLAQTERRERVSRKKETKQHRKLYSNLATKLAAAASKGEKKGKLGNTLSMLAALTGAGLPAVVALQFLGSYFGGLGGAKESRKYAKGIKGYKGTKFQKELDAYTSEVGSDVLAKSLTDAGITAATMAIGPKITGGIKGFGEGIKKGLGTLTGKQVTKAAPKNILTKLLEKKTPLSQLLTRKVPAKILGKELPLKFGKGLAEMLGGKKGDLLADRALSTLFAGTQKKKRPSIYEYEIPESLGYPREYRGGR